MEENGIISKSNSPWAFPAIVVPKKSGEEFSPRWVINYRELNKCTLKDKYPLPRIDDILRTMPPNIKFFSVFDLFTGFHQVRLTKRA